MCNLYINLCSKVSAEKCVKIVLSESAVLQKECGRLYKFESEIDIMCMYLCVCERERCSVCKCVIVCLSVCVFDCV